MPVSEKTNPLIPIGSAFLLGAVSPGIAQPSSNPYNLTIEDELETKYNNEIADYWRDHGREGSFTGHDGVEIVYMSFIVPGSETAIVISSGRTESLLKYKELIYDLAAQGYSVFIHDHRGQGLSGRLPPAHDSNDVFELQKGHVETFDHYVDDLKVFFDDVVKPNNYKKHVLLAHSMGGAVASLYIEEYAADFDAAVLSSPMHEPDTGWLPPVIACWFVLKPKVWLGKGFDYAPDKRPYDEDETFEPENCCTHSALRYAIARQEFSNREKAKLGGPTVRWALEACRAGDKARANAGKISIPVLLLQAGNDGVVTAKGQNTFCANLNRENPGGCRLKTIPEAYHELFMESDEYRLQTMNLILEFIADVTAE